MLRILSSPAVTMAVFVAMAFYLIQGRFLGGSLGPEGMIIFASVLMLQSLWSFIYRLVRLFRPSGIVVPSRLQDRGTFLDKGLEEAEELLLREGLHVTEGSGTDLDIVQCYCRNEKRTLIIEIVSYGLLLFILILGVINYGISVRGFVSISPGGEWTDVGKNLQRLRKGFMADRSAIPMQIRATKLSHGDSDNPPEITIEIIQERNGRPEPEKLKPGDTIEKGNFRMLYTGDMYSAFITVKRGEHDLMAAPLKLFRQTDTDDPMLYRGKLYLSLPGASGFGLFDPMSERFRIRLFVQNELHIDSTFTYGEHAVDGDYFIAVTALSHSGRLEIWRKSYKNVLFATLAFLFMSVIMRLIFRTETVFLWTEDNKKLLYTKSKKLKRALKVQNG